MMRSKESTDYADYTDSRTKGPHIRVALFFIRLHLIHTQFQLGEEKPLVLHINRFNGFLFAQGKPLKRLREIGSGPANSPG
jgi:hypothetical protein